MSVGQNEPPTTSSSASLPNEFVAQNSHQATVLRRFGPWREVESKTRNGRIYYYNRLTEVSTWSKPAEWEAHDAQQHEADRGLLSEPEGTSSLSAS